MQEVCLLYKNIFENDQYGFEPVIESVNDSNGFPTICVLTTIAGWNLKYTSRRQF